MAKEFEKETLDAARAGVPDGGFEGTNGLMSFFKGNRLIFIDPNKNPAEAGLAAFGSGDFDDSVWTTTARIVDGHAEPAIPVKVLLEVLAESFLGFAFDDQ